MKLRLKLGLLLFFLSFCALQTPSITGAVVGVNNAGTMSLALFGAMIALAAGLQIDSRPNWAESSWRLYEANKLSERMDIEQGYLHRDDLVKKIQSRQNARTLPWNTEDASLDELVLPNQGTTYESQFMQGHAAQGGRVIQVDSHIATKGKHRGKLVHFGQPANARYVWVVDEKGEFILGNRQTMTHDLPYMDDEKIDYDHRAKKLPHPTLAKGKAVYGAGEVLVMGGKIAEFDPRTGHYVDLTDIKGFNKQTENVFRSAAKKAGWLGADTAEFLTSMKKRG